MDQEGVTMAGQVQKQPFDWDEYYRDLLALTYAQCPEDVDAIPDRGPDFPAGWYIEKVAKIKDNAERLAALEQQREQYTADLDRTIASYRRVRAGDVSGLTDYDREIAYGGNRVTAIRGSLLLASAHISFYRAVIGEIDRQLPATQAAVARDRAQMSLF